MKLGEDLASGLSTARIMTQARLMTATIPSISIIP